jgi:hypothetical protein
MSTPKAKFSLPMVILAGITLVLSSYGLYELAHTYADTPAPLALLAVAGFDLTALAAGHQALTVARDGDSAGPWNALLVVAASLSAVLQYAHTSLAGQPWSVGIMFAMFPIATVLLFEGTLRRAHRLNGRRTGRVAQPRASFELLQWLVFPRHTARAFKKGIRDRRLSPDAAFKLAVMELESDETDDYVPPALLEVEMDYSRSLRGHAQITSGQSGQSPDSSGQSPDSSADPSGQSPDTRPLTVLVRESLQVRGPDEESVVADVQAIRPDAKDASIRRIFRKESGPRSA